MYDACLETINFMYFLLNLETHAYLVAGGTM